MLFGFFVGFSCFWFLKQCLPVAILIFAFAIVMYMRYLLVPFMFLLSRCYLSSKFFLRMVDIIALGRGTVRRDAIWFFAAGLMPLSP